MSGEFLFSSRFRIGRRLRKFSQDQIKKEPMLFKSDWRFALENAGPITLDFLNSIPAKWSNDDKGLLIDSRSHMLMPGWYPCIPGWHHDDVPRERVDGQPEYRNPSYRSEHIMALFGDASLTEFAEGESRFPDVPIGSVYYREWHPLVERRIQAGELRRFIAPERRLIHFNWNTWHQGTPATKSGWRFFIRITRLSKEVARNEIRTQAQVYMPAPLAGW